MSWFFYFLFFGLGGATLIGAFSGNSASSNSGGGDSYDDHGDYHNGWDNHDGWGCDSHSSFDSCDGGDED